MSLIELSYNIIINTYKNKYIYIYIYISIYHYIISYYIILYYIILYYIHIYINGNDHRNWIWVTELKSLSDYYENEIQIFFFINYWLFSKIRI